MKMSLEQKINEAKMATWGEGIQVYISRIEEWRGKGGLQEVCVCFGLWSHFVVPIDQMHKSDHEIAR